MLEFLTHFTYIGVALVLFFGGFLPWPEDVPLLLAGYLCGTGHAHPAIMMPVCVVAVVGGDLLMYVLGLRWGHHVPKLPVIRRFLPEKRLAKAEASFQAHGGKTIFIARFLPGLRASVFFTAGVFKVPTWKFIVYDAMVAVVSVPIVVGIGWWGAGQIDLIMDLMHALRWYIAAFVLGSAGGWALLRWRRSRARERGEASKATKQPSRKTGKRRAIATGPSA
jgi:membrane protein DedA with SNARE-associated domain